MRNGVTIAGKSLVFNIAFVVVNLTGLSFLVFANIRSSSDSFALFTSLGLGLMILSIAGLIIFKGRMMISSVSRVLVGGLFIVSGLVKANDPLGFSYKLEEYFEDGALAYRIKELFGAPSFSLEFLMDSALILSVIICIAEIILGVLTIIGGKIKLVSYLLLAMMLFFTFLTWHTANCDPDAKYLDRDTYEMSDPVAAKKLKAAEEKKVTIVSQTSSELVVDEMKSPQCVDDCGCFGDALKGSVGRSLTPNESLWKDLILLYLVIWIFVAQHIIKPNTVKENLIYSVSSIVVITFFSWVFGWYFPILFGLIAILGALWIRRAGGRLFGNYWGSAAFVAVLCGLLVTFVLMYSPIKDYRAYAVGSNLIEKMEDGEPSVKQQVMIYQNIRTGEKKDIIYPSEEYDRIWTNEDWKFDKYGEERVIKEEIPASISDFDPFLRMEYLSDAERRLEFVQAKIVGTKVKRIRLTTLEDQTTQEIALSEFNLESYPVDQYQVLDTVEIVKEPTDDVEIKSDIISEDRIVLLVSKSLTEANWSGIDRIKEIASKCEQKGVPFVLLTNATRKEIDSFRKDQNFDCAIFSMDQIELKIISRSNPALLVIEKGIVKEKYSRRTIPTGKRFKEIHLKK